MLGLVKGWLLRILWNAVYVCVCSPTLLALQTNIPIFKVKESSVRRRYRDFEWLKKELERDSKVRGGCSAHRHFPSLARLVLQLWRGHTTIVVWCVYFYMAVNSLA